MLTCLCSCGNSSTNTIIHNYPVRHYSMHANTYQNGFICTATKSETNAAYFVDYETLQSVPLCNKPNCTHDNDSCLAYQCVNTSALPVVYQDQIYWFETDSQIVEEKGGKSTNYQFDTTCYYADLKTGEKKEFVEIPDVSMKDATEMVIANGVLYVIGCDQAYQTEEGTWMEISSCGDQYLYAIDLETAEVKNYGLINDAPTAYYNWTLDYAMFFGVQLTGIYQNKLYLSYRYVDKATDLTDYFSHIDFDDSNWSLADADASIPWNRVNKCLNLKTGTIEISDLPIAEVIEEEGYVYYDETFCVMDQEGNVSKSPGIVRDGYINQTFVGGKFWKGSQNLCFDPETGKDLPLAEKYQGKDITVLDLYKGNYIIQYYDENYEYQFESVPEEELLSS